MKNLQFRAFVLFSVSALVACSDEDLTTSASCGNGEIEVTEACDDGNVASEDGCSATCVLETGWSCPPFGGLPCSTACGDSILAGLEECDDGNSASGDGCSQVCTVEQTGAEVCDDATDNDGDGLTDCDDEDCASVCVDPEDCTDGIDNDGDLAADCDDDDCRLSAECQRVVEEDCASPGDEDSNGLADCDDPACSCECGDGVIQRDELCDDGDNNSDELPDACRTSCSPARCGDDVVDTGEQCDGSAPAGSVCNDCTLTAEAICGETGRYVALSVDDATGSLSERLDFGLEAVDDFALPAGCTTIDGRDATVELSVPTDGIYVLRVEGTASTDRFAVSQSASCEAAFASQCASATRGRPAGLVMELTAEAPIIVRVEATPMTLSGTLTVQQVDTIVAAGAACDPDDVRNPCGLGFECTDVTGATVCAPVPVVPGMVGESCAPGVANECVAGALCDATTSSCVAAAGTTCASSVNLGDVMEADGAPFDVELVASTGAIQGTCETFPRVIALNLDVDRPTWVSVEAESVDGSPIALSARSVCTQVVSELTCRRDNAGTSNALFFLSGGGDGGTLLISGLSTASVVVNRIRARALDESCDVAGVTNRCQPGLECASGTCQASLAGSCGDPLPGFLAAEGDLTDRGLAVSFDTGTVSASLRPECGTPLKRQVFRFESPASGTLTARLGETVTGAFVELGEDCASAAPLDSCIGDATDTRVVRAGESFDVSVSSGDDVAGILTLVLEEQEDTGGTCSTASDCLPGLNCVADVCTSPPVLPGQNCVPSVSVCTVGNACLPSGDAFVCSAAVVGERQACEVFAGLPSCSGLLVCVDEGGGKLCAAPSVPDCARDEDCALAFRCDAGACVAREGGSAGSSCDLFTPNACAEGLSCTVPSGGVPADAICADNGGAECDGTRPCDSGEVCFEGACYVPLVVGASCDPEEPPPCAMAVACGGPAGAETCGGGLGGVGASCTASSGCLPGLYCNVVGPMGFCAARRTEGASCFSTGPADQCAEGLVCAPDPVTTFTVCMAAP